MLRVCFTLLFVLGSFACSIAQSISGTINDYTNVTNIAGVNLTVGSAASFAAGDRVLIIQMKGATINQANTASYGDVTAYNDAGNFEFATIASISGNVVTLSGILCQTYTIADDVQLIRVPVYANPTVSATLTGQAWNGTTGGVVVFQASGTVTLTADIDASGLGFRGGAFQNGGFSCGHSDYRSPLGQGGSKGESIADYIAGQESARGKISNGGGGSNRGNSGAGGGSNSGAGGLGGRIYTGCGANTIQGVGGAALAQVQGKVFLGGGGGGGFRDNGRPVTPGATGGGIVIIEAGSISGNGGDILANGNDVAGVTNDEGAGAGGGGGSVLLFCNNYPAAFSISTNGGAGGNTFNNLFTSQCHGPGGGGGGGMLWMQPATLPVTVTHSASGGSCGLVTNPVQPCFNTTLFGTNGAGGQTLFNLSSAASSGSVFLGPDTTLCAGTSLTLDAGAGYTSYLWSNAAVTQTITVSTAGTYWVQVTGGCGAANDTIVVSVAPNPTVSLGNDTLVCIGQSITLDAGPGFSTYAWSNSSSGQTLTVTTPGQYEVTVTNAGGCTAADTVQFGNHPQPVVNLGPDVAICSGNSQTFDAGAGFSSYVWQNASTAQTFTATASGNYHVTVTDANGCTDRDTVQLTVNPLPIVNLGPDQSVCAGQTANFDAGAGFSAYVWQDGFTGQVYTASTSGTYSVTVTDGNGCQNSDDAVLTVNPLPTPNLGPDFLLCAGSNQVITPGGTFSTYQWQDGWQGISYNVMTPGTYWVQVTDANGCTARDSVVVVGETPSVNLGPDVTLCDGDDVTWYGGAGFASYVWQDGSTGSTLTANTVGTYSVTVTTNNGCTATDDVSILGVVPIPQIELGNDTSICEGTTLTLDATYPGATYSWSNGSTGATTVVQPFIATHIVAVTVPPGCTGYDTLRITGRDPVPVATLGGDQTLCEGDSVIFDAGPGFAGLYQWSTGAASQTIVANQPGTYSVTISNKCGTASDAATILPLLLPPTVELGPNQFVCTDVLPPVELDAGGPYTSYIWNDNSFERFRTIYEAGLYYVEARNECGTASDSVFVVEDCPPRIFWPTGFTPNGDGLNDVFGPIGDGTEQYSLMIFDRWGKLIFEANQQSQTWDGNWNGQPLPEGAYVYRARYTVSEYGQPKERTVNGTVTLIR